MTRINDRVRMRVLLRDDELADALRRDVLVGLTSTPKQLPPKWLYDGRGCELFDAITELDEYYPTRREHPILVEHASAIARLCPIDTLVELGSGASPKTRILIDALSADVPLRDFIALDVAESALRSASVGLEAKYPELSITTIVGDFEHHLAYVPDGGTRLFAFLGGTIGNLEPAARQRFLAELAAAMHPGDLFLVGTDLIKDRSRLIAAYDDARGVTAAFNRNVLCFLNREVGADFDPFTFDHIAHFDETHSWIEMRLRSRIDQTVVIPSLGLVVDFARGEHIRTEISAKFTIEQICVELTRQGLEPLAQWTDHAGDFGVTLSRRS